MAAIALTFTRGDVDNARAGSIESAPAVDRVFKALALPPSVDPSSCRFESLGRACWCTENRSLREASIRGANSPASAGRLFFDGRLENADELRRELDLGPRADPSDLADAAWRRWGQGAWQHLLGPFVAVVVEPFEQRITAVRDRFGGRALYYHLSRDLLVIASEPSAVACHPAVDDALDQETLRAWCELRPTPEGSTFFRHVRELLPGQVLIVTPDKARFNDLDAWRPECLDSYSESDYVEAFRERFQRAVDHRCDPERPTAVLMSGGLDSTSVAAMASPRGGLGGGLGGSARPQAFSWVFDHHPRADERTYIHAMKEALPIELHEIVGDDGWSLRRPETWATDPNGPYEGPYRELRRRAYRAAAERGCHVMLTGEYGDELFAGSSRWLTEWIDADGVAPAMSWLLRHGPRAARSRYPLGLRSGLSHLAARHRRAAPDVGQHHSAAGRPEQTDTFLSAEGARPVVLESRHSSRDGIELRRPFRDYRLAAFMWGLPAHLLFRPGWTKWLLREAMRGRLPESVRARRRVSSLISLCAKGLLEAERDAVLDLIGHADAAHRPFVDPVWLQNAYENTLPSLQDGPAWVVLWRSICLELWVRHRRSLNHSNPSQESPLPSGAIG